MNLKSILIPIIAITIVFSFGACKKKKVYIGGSSCEVGSVSFSQTGVHGDNLLHDGLTNVVSDTNDSIPQTRFYSLRTEKSCTSTVTVQVDLADGSEGLVEWYYLLSPTNYSVVMIESYKRKFIFEDGNIAEAGLKFIGFGEVVITTWIDEVLISEKTIRVN